MFCILLSDFEYQSLAIFTGKVDCAGSSWLKNEPGTTSTINFSSTCSCLFYKIMKNAFVPLSILDYNICIFISDFKKIILGNHLSCTYSVCLVLTKSDRQRIINCIYYATSLLDTAVLHHQSWLVGFRPITPSVFVQRQSGIPAKYACQYK